MYLCKQCGTSESIGCHGTKQGRWNRGRGARGVLAPPPILDLRTRMLSMNNWLLHSLSRQPPNCIYVPPPLVPRDQLSLLLASFPGSHAGEEEREPGTHCSHTCQVPLVTCILLHYIKINGKICSPAEKLALFPSLPTIKFLITCSMQIWGKKAWSILSHE